MYPLDPNRLRLPDDSTWDGKPPPSKRPPRHKPGESFLKGPIPWSWLVRAARLPGKALHVALAVWFGAGMKRKRTVPLSYKVMAKLGCPRETARRGLKSLESAALVSVERHPGRSPRVTIEEVDVQAEDGDSG